MCVPSPPRKRFATENVLQSMRTPGKDATGQSFNLKYKKHVFIDSSVATTASIANLRAAAEGEDRLEFLRQYCSL